MSFKVYEEDQGITVYWGSNIVARYIVRDAFLLQNIRSGGYNSLESIPFVEGELKNPYSKYSQNYEAVEEVIYLYNNMEEGLPEKEPTFSFY